jgi:hypothetical protein
MRSDLRASDSQLSKPGGSSPAGTMDASPVADSKNTPSSPRPRPQPPGAEADDEQVETFYALLANIRAMNRVYARTTLGKRPPPGRGRGEEPPWRPAFRMEDFETEAEVGSDFGRRKRNRNCSCETRKPAGTVAADNDKDDEAADVVVVVLTAKQKAGGVRSPTAS